MQPADKHARLPPTIPSTSMELHAHDARIPGPPRPCFVGLNPPSAGITHPQTAGAEHRIQHASPHLPQQQAYLTVHTYPQHGSYPPAAQHPSRLLEPIQSLSASSSEHSSPSPVAPDANANGPLTTHISTPSGKVYRRPVPCESCREWRRKCDLSKPICNRCQERGQACVYILHRYDRKKRTLQQKPAAVMNPMSISSIVDDDEADSVASAAGPSQQASTPRNTRDRACRSCHKRKTKCDKHKPSCGDCLTRGMSCQY